MKKALIMALVALTFLFVGCSEKIKTDFSDLEPELTKKEKDQIVKMLEKPATKSQNRGYDALIKEISGFYNPFNVGLEQWAYWYKQDYFERTDFLLNEINKKFPDRKEEVQQWVNSHIAARDKLIRETNKALESGDLTLINNTIAGVEGMYGEWVYSQKSFLPRAQQILEEK